MNSALTDDERVTQLLGAKLGDLAKEQSLHDNALAFNRFIGMASVTLRDHPREIDASWLVSRLNSVLTTKY